MSKQFYTEGTGADQVLKEDADNIVKVFEKAEDIDVSELEDNEVVFTTRDALDTAVIAQSITDKVEENIEKIVNNSGMPVGSIVSIDNKNDIAGWLKCDGSKFDTTEYPFLYSALNSDKLPTIIEEDEWKIDTELFTGKWYNGKPVYKYSFYRNATLPSTTWTAIYPSNDNYWPYTHNVQQIVEMHTIGSHATTYRNGRVDTLIAEYNNATLDSETGRYVPSATSTLYVYSDHQVYYSVNDPLLWEIYYTKVEDDFTNAKYKYIKALSGVQTEAEATQVTDAIEAYKNKLTDTSGVPCGTLIEGKWNEAPAGYLKCDGSTFDEDKYPILYAKLGNRNVLPIELSINDSWVLNEDVVTGKWYDGKPVYRYTLQYTTATNANTWYTVPNSAELINTLKISKIIDSRMSDTSGSNSNYTYLNGTEPFKLFKTASGLQFYVPTMSSNAYNVNHTDQKWLSFEYVKTEDDYTNAQFKYIKATSGINPDESDSVVDAVKELTDKVAYSSLPLGNVIELNNNDVTPAGYLLADGSEFDETKYPLLYAYLGNTNVLPELGSELDYEHPIYLTYTGNQDNTNSLYNTRRLNTFEIEKSGLFIANFNGINGGGGWVLVNGKMIDKMSSHGGTWYGFSTPCFPVKKGDVVTVYLYGNADWYNFQTLIPYKTFKYIKAVTGVEENTDEAIEVSNAIATATTALQNNYDAFVDEVNNRDYRTEYILWEGANTYTNIPVNTTLADSLLNYDTIKWYARRSAGATADYLPVMITDHRQIEEALTSTGTYTYLFPGYASEYRELKFSADGLTVTAVSGGECIYRIVGVGKRS